ncbi:hypothetical protein [Chryseobacterium sp. PMSZPI]|uniref:hypothetical protein n=1 Tax=Chryseobacterium sp. PMSZPI TaxID=1033900 RepID=UPI000C3322AF|nr:hypothetical protein [Chryseobacterium sp. PMSZPI]PKF75512.1 hypothetical protein CW752_03610 [Chryseobacterium sp. PMSZPI]
MNTKKAVLKNAQKLGRDQQKAIKGGGNSSRYCCEWVNGHCTQWEDNEESCPEVYSEEEE